MSWLSKFKFTVKDLCTQMGNYMYMAYQWPIFRQIYLIEDTDYLKIFCGGKCFLKNTFDIKCLVQRLTAGGKCGGKHKWLNCLNFFLFNELAWILPGNKTRVNSTFSYLINNHSDCYCFFFRRRGCYFFTVFFAPRRCLFKRKYFIQEEVFYSRFLIKGSTESKKSLKILIISCPK